MKILVRNHQNNLIWKEAVYKDGRFVSVEDNKTYEVNAIYTVQDDDRHKIVICSGCNKEIPNTPSAIKAHQNMINKSNKCFECRHLRKSNETVVSQKYVLNDDGTYNESTKRTVNLNCCRGWTYRDINSEEARNGCKYAACVEAKFNKIEDFWTKYPNAFDEFITIDRIIDTGYKSLYRYADCVCFDLKGRVRIEAYVNNQGICYNFEFHYYQSSYSLRYSKKYDKVWFVDSGTYRELDVLNISADAKEAIIKKLRTLYQ